MSFAYKKLNQQDVSKEQYTANKGYTSSLDRLLEDNYTVLFGQRPVSGALFDPKNAPKNPDGSYRELVYSGIKHLYYFNYVTGSLTGSFFRSSSYYNYDQNTLVSGNLDTVVKQFPLAGGARELYDSMSFYDTEAIYDGSNSANLLVLDFDKTKFGSGINPGTFNISSSQFVVKDDGLGNLYALTSSVFQAPYNDPQSSYTQVVYGPNSSSVSVFDLENAHQTYIGNIVYSHGLAIVTHPEFLCILGSAPVALNDYVTKLNVSCSKVLDLLNNDFDDCYQIDPKTIDFHDTGSWPFNYALDDNGFITLTPDELSTTPGSYSLGYTVRNELGRVSNSGSYNLFLESFPVTGVIDQIETICEPDRGFSNPEGREHLTHPTGAVTFSIDLGTPYYSWSNDNVNYTPVPDLCQPIVSGTVSASLNGIIYLKDRYGDICELPYSNVYPSLRLAITTQSVGWCVNDPFIFPSPSATPSMTPSKTPSISFTRTPSRTPSISPSVNNSPSSTPTPTRTRTASTTPSITRTPTRTVTPSTSFSCLDYGVVLTSDTTSASDACGNDNNNATFYRHNGPSTTEFYNSTDFRVANGCTTAPSGFYSNGYVVARWTGTSWTNLQICDAGGGGGGGSS